MKKNVATKSQLSRRATAAAQRAAVIADGGKALYILLDAKHAKLLARAMKMNNETAKDLIQGLIRAYL